MQFITNRICTGKGKKFEDFVRELSNPKETVKTASAATPVVKKAEQEEAESSGQLKVEPLHQKGESTEMPKKGPKAKKEGDEAPAKEKEAKVVKQDEQGKDSKQPKWEGEQKNNNEPEVDKETKGGAAKTEVKVAEENCKECGKPCGECKCEDCKCASCTKTKKVAETKKAALEDLPQAVQDKIKGKKDGDADEEEKDDKEASKKVDKNATAHHWVKISNLDTKNKGFLRKFWRQLFNEDYVNALLADK